ELIRLGNQATLYRQTELALRLQALSDRLSDELDAEEEINNQAGIQPCPPQLSVPTAQSIVRASVLAAVQRRMPYCHINATGLGLTYAARRSFMQQCLRVVP